MNEKILKRMILNLEKLQNTRQEMEVLRARAEKDIKEIQGIELKLTKTVKSEIENFLQGQILNGQEIKFIPPGNTRTPIARWIYGFSIRKDGKLEVIIAENLSGDMVYKTVSYDFTTDKLCLEGGVK